MKTKLQTVLEALEIAHPYFTHTKTCTEAIAIVRGMMAQEPVAWMDGTGGVHSCPRKHLFGLVDNSCGSKEVLWSGYTFDEALEAWAHTVETHTEPETVKLTGLNSGVIAEFETLKWKLATPEGTFACPICKKETPHTHSAEDVIAHNEIEVWWQEHLGKSWEEVKKRAADLEARYPWYAKLYAFKDTP